MKFCSVRIYSTFNFLHFAKCESKARQAQTRIWIQIYPFSHFLVGNFSEQEISLTSQKFLLTLEALDIFCNSSLECCCTNNKASNTRSQRQVDVSLFPTTHACTIIRLKNVGHQQHPILWTLVKYLHNVLLKVENGAYKFYPKIFLNHLLSFHSYLGLVLSILYCRHSGPLLHYGVNFCAL